MGFDRAPAAPEAAAVSVSRSQANRQSEGVDGHSVRSEVRHSVGDAAQGNGLRQRNDVLAAVARLAASGRVGEDTSCVAGTPAAGGSD